MIASPNWHRWHHSVEATAHNKNYANIFSFLDVAFGTYYNPGTCRTEIGLLDAPRPTVINQLIYPFSYLAQQAWTIDDGATSAPGASSELHRQ